MPAPVTSDALLQARANTLRTLLNSGHHLRLFANDVEPAPDTPRADYTEAAFGGYAAVNLTGAFGVAGQVQAGQWRFEAGPFTFTCDGSPPQVIFGWYIDSGTDVPFAQRFNDPVALIPGKALHISVRPTEWSVSLRP